MKLFLIVPNTTFSVEAVESSRNFTKLDVPTVPVRLFMTELKMGYYTSCLCLGLISFCKLGNLWLRPNLKYTFFEVFLKN